MSHTYMLYMQRRERTLLHYIWSISSARRLAIDMGTRYGHFLYLFVYLRVASIQRNKYTALDARDYFTMCNNVTTRAHPHKLLLPRFTTDCWKFFLVLVLYVSGTTCQLMWTLQVSSLLCVQLTALILRFIVILMCDQIVFYYFML